MKRDAKGRFASGGGGLPSMGNAASAKARAFARKPKGASAQNAGSKAASKARKVKRGLT